ncbi:aminodeoxychorismate lyase, partial [Mycobacterium sp. ITM-2017-0098]
QGVWLVSSITLGARVHTLDGKALADTPLADDMAALIDAAIVCDR